MLRVPKRNGQKISPPPIASDYEKKMVIDTREYKLITPLFGGGVKAGEVDQKTPIRGTSIRGQLRFWWRACRGGQFETLSEMKQAEDKLWGGASTKEKKSPSLVQINVIQGAKGEADSPFIKVDVRGRDRTRTSDDWRRLAYAAFPLQEGLGTVQKGISFQLTISYPARSVDQFKLDIADEVNAALWAWETFGGIGARTRRGFGAIARVDTAKLPQTREQCAEYIAAGLQKHVVDGTPPSHVPHLSKDGDGVRIVGKPQDPMIIWGDLISTLKNFRQARDDKNHSLWPEPNSIRRIEGLRDFGGIDAFPRAQLGLPIIFHFKDRYDPQDTILEGQEAEEKRMASPLILRPMVCGENTAVGLALRLSGTSLPKNVVLRGRNGSGQIVKTALSPEEAKSIEPLDGMTDVLAALLEKYK